MALWAAFTFGAAAAEPEPLTLPAAIEEALSANLELRREAIAVGLNEAGLVRARGRWDPALGFRASTDVSNSLNNDSLIAQDVISVSSTSWSASLSQALPTGGRLGASWSEFRSTSDNPNLFDATTVSTSASLSIDQPLLRGFGPAALWDLRQAELSVTQAQIGWRASVEQAVLDVADAYWRLVAADQRAALSEQSRAIAEDAVADMEERFEAGFVGSGDVLQMRRTFGTARQSEVSAIAAREAANNALCRLLGRDVRDAPTLDPVDTPVVPDALPEAASVLASAMERNARFVQARLGVDQARLAVKQQRSQALPDLSLSGNFGVTGLDVDAAGARRTALAGDFNAYGVGASIAVPLLGRATRAGLREAKLNAEDARLSQLAAEQDLVLRVQNALRAVQRDRLQVELATETERVAALALQADQELLADGRGASRNVALSLEQLQAAGISLLEAQIALQASLLEVQRVAGTLVAPADVPDAARVRSAGPR